MRTTNSFGRYLLYGSKFLWRVGGIFIGFVAAGSWEACKAVVSANSGEPAATPRIAGEQDAWAAFQKDQISLGELITYEQLDK